MWFTFPASVWNRIRRFGLEMSWTEPWTTAALNNGLGCYWQSVSTLEIWAYIHVIYKSVI